MTSKLDDLLYSGEPMTLDLTGLPAHRARLLVTFSNGLPSILGKWVEVNELELEALRITLEMVAGGKAEYLMVETGKDAVYVPKAMLAGAVTRLEVRGINE